MTRVSTHTRRSATAAALALVTVLFATAAVGDRSPRHGSDKAPTFTNVIKSAGIQTPNLTYSGQGIDVDRDGDQDIFISYHTHGGRLWRNDGRGHFTRIASASWPRFIAGDKVIDRHHCAWADVDRNGRIDAYCTTGRTVANFVKRGRDNELWLQRHDGTFDEVGTAWHVGDQCGRGRSAEFVDANGDRFPDLFLANSMPRNMPDECDTSPTLPNERSKLFINRGGKTFKYVPKMLHAGSGLGEECIVPLDFDGDSWQDLYLCRTQTQPPALYRNKNGKRYVDVSANHALTARVADAQAIDLEHDGDPDLVTAGTHAFHYQLNVGGVFAEPVTIGSIAAGGNGWAVAVADIDGDGDRDVYGMIGDRTLASNPNDVVFLRDGLTFTPTPVPPAGGLADDVVVVTPWQSGQVGLLVLNGFDKCCGAGAHRLGPLALFRWSGP